MFPTLVEVKFPEDELDHQRGLEPVSHEAQAQVQAQMQWDRVRHGVDALVLLNGNGHCSAYVAKWHHQKRCTRAVT